MNIKLDAHAQVPLRLAVVDAQGKAVSNTNAIEVALKDAVLAVLESVPTQSAASATVADLVTALKTIPAQAV